jgi:hypothetical protein
VEESGLTVVRAASVTVYTACSADDPASLDRSEEI